MAVLLSPWRKLLVEGPSVGFVDVTRNLGDTDVIVEEEDVALSQMTFTLTRGAVSISEYMQIGSAVSLEGGYAKENRTFITKRILFEGYVTKLEPVLPSTGRPKLVVTCQTQLYRLTRSRPGNITYPGTRRKGRTYQREWHFRPKIKMSEIIEGILDDHGIDVNRISIPKKRDRVFTRKDPISQKEDESDYEFVRRLLTGKSNLRLSNISKKERERLKTINARCRFFMEWHPVTQAHRAYVLSEEELLDTVGSVSFRYHSSDTGIVFPNEYDPTKPASEIIVREARIKVNPDKARRSLRKQKNVSAQRQDDVDMVQFEEDVPDLTDLTEYELNEEKVRADRAEGLISAQTAADILSGRLRLPWSELKQYFILKTTSQVAAGRNMEPDGSPDADKIQTREEVDDLAGEVEGPPKNLAQNASGGNGSPGTRRSKRSKGKKKSIIGQLGMSVSFKCDGNIFVTPRKSYTIVVPFGAYSGEWYASKVKHILGRRYKMEMELVR